MNSLEEHIQNFDKKLNDFVQSFQQIKLINETLKQNIVELETKNQDLQNQFNLLKENQAKEIEDFKEKIDTQIIKIDDFLKSLK